MSIPFSNTTLKNGLIQVIERTLGMSDGQISGNATLLAYFTADINLTIDEVFGFMFPLGGTWQLDDANHTAYPFIYTNLVSGQRDYTFLTDQQGNVILDIYKVMVADSSGFFREITPIDQQTADSNVFNTDTFINGQNLGGTPTRYDKTGNSIFLDLIPNYNFTNGLKVFINREGNYFVSTDTTKTVGFAHLFHEYFALKAAYKYARTKGMSVAGGRLRNGAFTGLLAEIDTLEQGIKNYYGKREKDVKPRLVANREYTK
jgi:hypothetical protein